MKKAFLVVGFGLMLLVSVLWVRTARLNSKQIPADPSIDFAVDGRKVAEQLANALRFQTISYEDPAQSNADEFVGFHEYLEETFPLVHSTLRKELVGGFSLLYTWEGQDEGLKPILLTAHQDVVPVDPRTEEDWTYSPFEGRIAEGYIWGRGAMDNKHGVMGILEAIEILLGEGYRPRATVIVAFGDDEEVGGLRGASQIADLLQSRGAEVEYVLDEGLPIADGMVPGVSEPVAMVGIAEKGYVSIELAVEGAGGHSSMPPPHTAVGILCTAIHNLERNQFPTRRDGVVREMFDYLAPEMSFGMRMAFANLWLFGGLVESRFTSSPETNATIRTTTAATMLEGSLKDNVLPTHARAVVNFRVLYGDSIPGVIEHVRRTIDDPRVEVKALGQLLSEPSPVTSTSSSNFALLQRTIRQVFPEVLVAPGQMLGATDARHYRNLTSDIYRFSPMWMTPADRERAHGTNERISVENYEQMVRFYAQLIKNSSR